MRKVLNIAPSQRYTRRPTHSQTTNLGVRSSNLFGRAIYVTGKPSLFRSSQTHRRLEETISLRFSLRNSRKIFALVGPRSGGCNPLQKYCEASAFEAAPKTHGKGRKLRGWH